METWKQVPTFDDENAKVRTKEHRASGAEIAEVVYGAVGPDNEPTVPEKFYPDGFDDGHGTWTGIRLGEEYTALFWKKPASEGGEEVLDHAHMDAFLKDLDALLREKRNLVDKAFDLLADRGADLATFEDIRASFEGLAAYGTPREKGLEERFAKALAKYENRIQRVREQQANLEAKEALVREAEKTAEAGEWKAGSLRMKELMDQWKQLGYAGAEANDRVWEAFQAARKTFFEKQRAYFRELDARRAEIRAAKEAIIAEARDAAEGSEEWNKTTARLNELFEKWKTLGSAGREQDDRLWAQFQQIRNAFYERKNAWFEQRSQRWQESRQRKEALIEEAREILASASFTKEAAERMKAMSQDWKQAGSSGHDADQGLWKTFREVQDAFWEGRKVSAQERHVQWIEKMQTLIVRKKDQISKLQQQNKKLQGRAELSADQSMIDQIFGWIEENVLKIGQLQEEIEDIERRLQE